MTESQTEQAINLPLLETKLYTPAWQADRVSRPRLVDRLRQGAGRKLTLVSAPAGFGKSTLLAEWTAAAARDRTFAWVALDADDNPPARFWLYNLQALERACPGLATQALSLLQSPQPMPIEAVLAALVNEAGARAAEVTLVLDDYHLIESEPIHSAMTFLIDHLPPTLHLLIACRSDPPLPLARLRAKGQLTELGAAELRFTASEAAAFLRDRMGLTVSSDDVAALEKRTEGWIAGLQLAALSLRGRPDRSRFIATFSGDDRYILDYLVEEVLNNQSEDVRRFLLHTSILDRLSAPLCDAVTGRTDSRAQLDYLARANLFLIPLYDQRRWYRYHHLFAEALRARLEDEQPDALSDLHHRASAWFEQAGQFADAVRHAFAAGEPERAADLVERAWPAMRRDRQEGLELEWLSALPEAVISKRPVLTVIHAWALLNGYELDAAERKLRQAEQMLDRIGRQGPDQAGLIVVDADQYRSLPGAIANARAYAAQARNDVPGTVRYARQALEHLPETDHYERGTNAALLGLAYWTGGDLEAAYRSFLDGLVDLWKGDGLLIRIGGTLVLASIRLAQGRLREAIRLFEESLPLAVRSDGTALPGAAELHMGISDLHRERGDMDQAREWLAKGDTLRTHASLPGYDYWWCTVQARMKEVEGDLEGALERLNAAQAAFYDSPIPAVQPIPAMHARIRIKQGRLDDAQAWAREHPTPAGAEIHYLREYDHLTRVRLLLARYRRQHDHDALGDALDLLGRLLTAAESGERGRSVIEILMLRALAHSARADRTAALAELEQALTLAEPEGFVRLFADEGEPMRDLLRQWAARGTYTDYTRTLLAAFDAAGDRNAHPEQALAEPLTRREIEILRLIAVGLRNQEIADQLSISLATVKRHIANVYGKLDVGHRTEALARANDLGLL